MDSEFAYITTARVKCKHPVSSLDREAGYFGMLPTETSSQKPLFLSSMEVNRMERDSAG